MPMVSVVMPVYNSEAHLKESIESILSQTFDDFELIIIHEFESNEKSEQIIKECQRLDDRIIFIQNDTKLGLAKSLNKGILSAKGKYIARMDADDISMPNRLEKQVSFLESNLDISLCGSWQQYFGTLNHIHKTATSNNDLKAGFIFACDMCHSTVMFRRNDFVDNNLYYDEKFHSEDYELWVRASEKLHFANIPEVLGLYRHDGNNITQAKLADLHYESAVITAQILKNLNIVIKQEDMCLLGSWNNIYEPWDNQLLNRKKKLLDEIISQNKKLKIYDQQSLLKAVGKRWLWVNRIDSNNTDIDINYNVIRGKNALNKAVKKMSFKHWCKSMIKKLARKPYRKIMNRFVHELDISHMSEIRSNIQQINVEIQNSLQGKINDVKEKVRSLEQNLMNEVYDAKQHFSSEIYNAKQHFSSEIYNAKQHLSNETQSAKSNLEYTLLGARDSILTSICDDIRKITLHQHVRISGIDRNVKKIFLLGTPYHQNIGDHAQSYCIREWLQHNYQDFIVYEIQSAYDDKFDFYPMMLLIREKLNKYDKIFIHSGYHTTDIYYNEQILTLAALNVFHESQIVIFPQTVFFNDEAKMNYVADVHNSHDNVIFMARESVSYEYAKKMLPKANLIKFPDIVFNLIGNFPVLEGNIRKGILFCLRKCSANESEYFDDKSLLSFTEEISKTYLPVDLYDTSLDLPVHEIEANREYVLRNNIFNRFVKYKAVVTNRYHGVIFSLIANTPVIVLKSSVHNLSAGTEWLNGIKDFEDYVYFCETFEQVTDAINKIYNLELEHKLPAYFKENYYDKLKNIID